MDVNDDTPCVNCGRDFADHQYIKDSVTKYKCPVNHQESVYGFFHGGDPRNFHPDAESCSPKELENHKAACQIWDDAEARGETPEPEKCPSGWHQDEHGNVYHVLRAPYGIGISTIEFEQLFEAGETFSDSDDDD